MVAKFFETNLNKDIGFKTHWKNPIKPIGESIEPVEKSIEKNEPESTGSTHLQNKEIHNGHLWSQKVF